MGDTVQPTSGSTFQVVLFPDTPTPGHRQDPRRFCVCVYTAAWPLFPSKLHLRTGRPAIGDLGLVCQGTASGAGFQSHDDVWVGTAHNPLDQVPWGSQTGNPSGSSQSRSKVSSAWTRVLGLEGGIKMGWGAGDHMGCALPSKGQKRI